ncbi:MAG: hypothetical protein J5699_01695 [Bacteroidales bacterium]|nr:hypothetical protein [Bacteroidales bacterium]
MEYGLIGGRLGHSFSREIHGMLSPAPYELRELTPEELPLFLKERDFKGINVTIPFKETGIPCLDTVSDEARAIGAVNTIVNKGGKLFGYNTDYFGLKELALSAGVGFEGRKVLILGAGGAAKTADALARDLGAASVTHAVRTPRESTQISLGSLREENGFEIIINCTPVGMFPDSEGRIIDINAFPRLKGLLDLVYNPLRTNLVLDAQEACIPAEGGLMMLVAQACRAQELFQDTTLPEGTIRKTYEKVLRSKRNIVLTGMPSSGKSTMGRMLSERTGMRFIDTDLMIAASAGRSIPEIFESEGETGFRLRESQVIRELSGLNGAIIATGGGAVLDPANVSRLKRNGTIYLIARDPERLTPTGDRPLSSNSEAMQKLFSQRREAYLQAAERIIDNNGTPEAAIAQFEL